VRASDQGRKLRPHRSAGPRFAEWFGAIETWLHHHAWHFFSGGRDTSRLYISNTATARDRRRPCPSRHFIGRPMKVKGPRPSSASRLHRLSMVGDVRGRGMPCGPCRFTSLSGPGRIEVDAEMHDALLRQPFGRGDIDAGIVGSNIPCAGRCVGGWPVQSRKPCRPSATATPAFFTAAWRSAGRDLGARARCAADRCRCPARCIFPAGYSFDRDAARAKMPGRIDVGAGVVGHRDEHRRQSVDVFWTRRNASSWFFQDAVDHGADGPDRSQTGDGGSRLEIDDLHGAPSGMQMVRKLIAAPAAASHRDISGI